MLSDLPTPTDVRAVPSALSVVLPRDGFVPDLELAAWLRRGWATQSGPTVSLSDGRKLFVVDAVRVLGRRDDETDPYGLTGSVLSLRDLVGRGMVIGAQGARLGSVTYDVQLGVLIAEQLPQTG